MRTLFGAAIDDIKYYWTLTTELDGIPVVISRTGWTGEVGYEIYLRDPSRGGDLWDRIMEAGKPHDIRPIAPCEARRIEAGIFNYGSDMTIDEQAVPRHGPRAAGRAAGRRLHRQGGARGDPRHGRRPQAGRHRGRRRRAAVRAVAQVRRAVGRQAGRDRDRPHLVAPAREEHRLRVGADRAGRPGQRRSRSSRPTAASGRRRPPRSRSSTRRRPSRWADRSGQETARDHAPAAHPRRDRRRPQAVPGRLAAARPGLSRPGDPRVRAGGVVPARLADRRARGGRGRAGHVLPGRRWTTSRSSSSAAGTTSCAPSTTSAATAARPSSRSRAGRPSASSARTTPGSTTSTAS